MAISIGYVAITYLSAEISRDASLLGPLLFGAASNPWLILTVSPVVAILFMVAIIFGGYRAYGKAY